MKTEQLAGAALDYYAAQHDPMCAGLIWERKGDHWAGVCNDGVSGVAAFILDDRVSMVLRGLHLRREYQGAGAYHPSRDGTHCVRMMTKYRINASAEDEPGGPWLAETPLRPVTGPNAAPCYGLMGDTLAIAITRAFVAMHYGLEVPDKEPEAAQHNV